MKFKNLYFKNFKNLKEVILPVLDNRIVLIVGDTGEGKSAIFEGIRYWFRCYK